MAWILGFFAKLWEEGTDASAEKGKSDGAPQGNVFGGFEYLLQCIHTRLGQPTRGFQSLRNQKTLGF